MSPTAPTPHPTRIVLKRGDELYAERRFGVRTTDRVVIALLAAEGAAGVLGVARRPSVDAQPETIPSKKVA